MDPLFRFTPWDHVVLGKRLRECREAVMGLLIVAPLDGEANRIARHTAAAVDRLRSELDCHLQMTRPLRRDPRRLSRHIYGGHAHGVRARACRTRRAHGVGAAHGAPAGGRAWRRSPRHLRRPGPDDARASRTSGRPAAREPCRWCLTSTLRGGAASAPNRRSRSRTRPTVIASCRRHRPNPAAGARTEHLICAR